MRQWPLNTALAVRFARRRRRSVEAGVGAGPRGTQFPSRDTRLTRRPPTRQTMIKQAIIAHPSEARTGLGRPSVKKYILANNAAAAKL
jgi:hypothetical protein